MSYSINAAENILEEIRMKAPRIQTLIGAGGGLVAAIGFFLLWFEIFYLKNETPFVAASIKIAESAALFGGAALLILSLMTDFVWVPNINCNFDFHILNSLVQKNGAIATGFIAGFLIGFALMW